MQLRAEAVKKIYLGQDRVCRCGCKGSYVERGEPAFEKRLKRFARMWANYQPTGNDVDNSYLNISYGNDRAMTAYFS